MLYLIHLYQLHFHKCFPLFLLFLTINKYTNDTFLLSAQCKSKTDYPVDKGPPVTPILCQINPVNMLIFWFCKTRSAPQLCSMRSVYQFLICWLLQKVVNLTLNSRAGGLPLVSCPQLLIQYIRSYRPEFGTVI